VGTTTLATISSQSSVNVAVPLSIPSEGTYTLVAVVNPAHTVAEVNYANDVAQVSASFVEDAWVQISSSAVRVEQYFVEFAASNSGTVELAFGQVTISVGSVSLGSANITNLQPQYCALIRVNSTTDLTLDTTAQVTISIAAPLSGSFTSTTVTTPVATATTAVLPDCDVPVNAAPSLNTDSNLIAIVGVLYSDVIKGTGVSPFLAPLLGFNQSNLPSDAILSDPCDVNSSVVCMKQEFSFTPSLTDIPSGQISVNRTFSVMLYDTADNSMLTSSNFTLTITSCGNGVVDGAEECDGGAGCTAGCMLSSSETSTTSPASSTTGSTNNKKSHRALRLGLGLGLGLALPLVVVGSVFGYWWYTKKIAPSRDVEMRGL